jgi:hypothetical protein
MRRLLERSASVGVCPVRRNERLQDPEPDGNSGTKRGANNASA